MYPAHNITDSQFLDILKTSIKNKEPFSFTRFGDGEICLISGDIPSIVKSQLRTTWGYSSLDQARNDILPIINLGLRDSDFIGLMDPGNTISKNISFTYKQWSIPLKYLESIRTKELLIVDHMITRGVDLGDIHNFKNVLQGASIAIVSPRVELLRNNELDKLLNVDINYIKVPLGMNLSDRSSIFKKLDSINELVVLYGCSINGKDFGVYLKSRGKIALDFGATLDAWGGLVTRSWFGENQLQNHCLIKK